MTIDVEACGILAQIYAVGLLAIAVEIRFLRDWNRGRVFLAARWVVGIVAALSMLGGLMAVVFMAQAVLFDYDLKGIPASFVQYGGLGLCIGIGSVLGGAIVSNTGWGGGPEPTQVDKENGIALAVAAAVSKALNDRDEAKRRAKVRAREGHGH